jgi:hypothetical protein
MEINDLIQKFAENELYYKRAKDKYNEMSVRDDFINP